MKNGVTIVRYEVRITKTKSWLWDKAAIIRKGYNFENLSCNYEEKVIVKKKAAITRNKVVIMR